MDYIFGSKRTYRICSKTDKTVIKMLEFKGDIFPEYNEKNFENILKQNVESFSKTNIESEELFMNLKANIIFFLCFFPAFIITPILVLKKFLFTSFIFLILILLNFFLVNIKREKKLLFNL